MGDCSQPVFRSQSSLVTRLPEYLQDNGKNIMRLLYGSEVRNVKKKLFPVEMGF
jgi:hypothetical protein